MNKIITTKTWMCALLMSLGVYTPCAAQSQPAPPARTYYTSDNNTGNKPVKERWAEDSKGQKNGAYFKYDRAGKVIAQYTYLHGLKEGAANYIDEYGTFNWHTPCKYVGSYKQDNKSGIWSLYLSVAGQPFSKSVDVIEKYDDAGNLYMSAFRSGGKNISMFTYNKQRERSGEARYYSKTDGTAYAQGKYEANKPAGVWQNAALSEDGSIIYAKGSKVAFENGVASSLTDNTGKVRSLVEEARSNEEIRAKHEAERQAAVAAAPIYYNRIEVYGMRFNQDSYLLTDKGKEKLASIAQAVNERATSPQKVSTIYLSAHAGEKIRPSSRSDSTKKMMYILSLNRALAVKTLLQEQLDDKTIKIVAYACANDLSVVDGDLRGFDVDNRVQMSFDEPLKNAQAAYAKLVEKYGIQVTDNIVPNKLLRRSILEVVDAYFQDDIVRDEMARCSMGKAKPEEYFGKIPRELWLPTPFSEKHGEYNPATFRAEVETRFAKLNKKYHVADSYEGNEINPSVLFHDDLRQYLAPKEE